MKKTFFPAIIVAFVFMSAPFFAQGQTDLQKEIDNHNSQISALNQEIALYEAQLKTTTTQKKTLQNKIDQLNLQRKKLNATINVTMNQIGTTQKQIVQISSNIDQKQFSIDQNLAGLAQSLRSLHDTEKQSLALALLSSENLSDAWQDMEALAIVQDAVAANIALLAEEKRSLSESKEDAESKKQQLQRQQSTLANQQGQLDATRKAQSELLAETKSQESSYQKILAQKKAQQASFEAALNNLKSQLVVNPSDIPTAGKGILQWPVDNVRISQYFGNTPFAAAGAYGGKGHNGMDFAAPIGTPLKAALGGAVAGTGNTDLVRGCYSFGKWVMIRHPNGLSTMYAHLSEVSVSTGQPVTAGQTIGYSGETGYATGPHLHFGVYVTAVTKIVRLGDATKSATACSGAVMPVPPTTGYLNPMNYL